MAGPPGGTDIWRDKSTEAMQHTIHPFPEAGKVRGADRRGRQAGS